MTEHVWIRRTEFLIDQEDVHLVEIPKGQVQWKVKQTPTGVVVHRTIQSGHGGRRHIQMLHRAIVGEGGAYSTARVTFVNGDTQDLRSENLAVERTSTCACMCWQPPWSGPSNCSDSTTLMPGCTR
jgi:hypothetical protein